MPSDPGDYEGVAGLTLSPTTILGGSGGSATGTVTLNAPAPEGGVVVTLASSNVELAATMPACRRAGRRDHRDLYRRHQRALSAVQRAGVQRHDLRHARGNAKRHAERHGTAAAGRLQQRLAGEREHAMARADVRRHRAHRGKQGDPLRCSPADRNRVRQLHLPPGMQPRLPQGSAEWPRVQRLLRHQRAECDRGEPQLLRQRGSRARHGRHRGRRSRFPPRACPAPSASRANVAQLLARRRRRAPLPTGAPPACRSTSPLRMCRRSSSSTSPASGIDDDIPPFLITNGGAGMPGWSMVPPESAAGAADTDAGPIQDVGFDPVDGGQAFARADPY